MSRERNSSLDGIRGLAAVGVFAFHCWLYTLPTVFSAMPAAPGTILLHELRVGWVLFFVLSGFVLFRPWVATRLDERPLAPPGTFAVRRIARIVPAYYVATAGSILLLWPLAGAPGLRLPDLGNLYLFAFFGQNFTPGTVMKLDPPTWTIAIEATYYAILPLLGWLALRGRGRLGLIGVPLAMIALGIVWNVTGPIGSALVWTKLLPAVLPYFAVGMLAAVWVHGRPYQPRQGLALVTAGAALIVINSVLHGIVGSGGPALQPAAAGDLLAATGFACVIGAAWLGSRGTGWLGSGPLVNMGTVTYGFYLWHVPVLVWLRAHDVLPLSAAGAMAVAFPIALLFANLSWHLVERPVLDSAHRSRPRLTGPAVEET